MKHHNTATIIVKQKSPGNRSEIPEINAYLNIIKTALQISKKNELFKSLRSSTA